MGAAASSSIWIVVLWLVRRAGGGECPLPSVVAVWVAAWQWRQRLGGRQPTRGK